MESFITYDHAVVCVPAEFLRRRMDNGVVPRLLGWDVPDGLTTPKPSRDQNGHLTILQHMQIRKHAFLKLLQFLRLGSIPSNVHQVVYDASVSLGGFEELDAYLGRAQQEPGPAAASPRAHHPMTPEDDTENKYVWTVRHMNTIERDTDEEAGWSVTRPVALQGEGTPCMHVYLRREKKKSSGREEEADEDPGAHY